MASRETLQKDQQHQHETCRRMLTHTQNGLFRVLIVQLFQFHQVKSSQQTTQEACSFVIMMDTCVRFL